MDIRNFVADMGLRPVGKTLDRIRPDGNYEPGNCRWADSREQNQNRRFNSITYEKLTAIKADVEAGMTQAMASKKYAVPKSTISRAVRGVTWGNHV